MWQRLREQAPQEVRDGPIVGFSSSTNVFRLLASHLDGN
jgi:hypothetical protein